MKAVNWKLSLLLFVVVFGICSIFLIASAFSQTTTILFSDTFEDGNLDGWTVFDAPGAISGPSNWSVVQAKDSSVLRQNSNIYTNANYEGTLVYAGQGTWANYHLDVDVYPDDDDSVFVLFRYADDQNYYRFIMNKQESFRRLEKKVDGIYTTLAEDTNNGYGTGWHNIHIAVESTTITVSLNYTQIFTASDSSLSTGMIGLGTSASTGCHFDNIVVSTSAVDPYADAVADANIMTEGNSQANPVLALGRPRGANDDMSIGGPGYWIVFDMGLGEEIVDGTGNDLRVYEVGVLLGGVDEDYNVFISNSPTGPWTFLGKGIAMTEFDLAGHALSNARYVRIEDLSTKTGSPFPGSDIDALQALQMADNYCFNPPTGLTWSAVGNDIHLSWSALNEAIGYKVYASSNSDLSAFYPVTSQPITTTRYVHVDAAQDNLYYAITAIGTEGCESRLSSIVPHRSFSPIILKD